MESVLLCVPTILFWVYHGPDSDLAQMIQGKPWVLRHDFQGEAICFEDYNLYLTNEARDIYALPPILV